MALGSAERTDFLTRDQSQAGEGAHPLVERPGLVPRAWRRPTMADTIQRVEYFNAQVPNKYGLAGLVLDRATKRILSDAGSSARYRGAAQYSPSVPGWRTDHTVLGTGNILCLTSECPGPIRTPAVDVWYLDVPSLRDESFRLSFFRGVNRSRRNSGTQQARCPMQQP